MEAPPSIRAHMGELENTDGCICQNLQHLLHDNRQNHLRRQPSCGDRTGATNATSLDNNLDNASIQKTATIDNLVTTNAALSKAIQDI